MAKTCNTRCNTDHNILLRNNIFYYRVELPRENGKRRFLCKSLKTYNYYEAREKAKIMAEQLQNFEVHEFIKSIELLWNQLSFGYEYPNFGKNIYGFMPNTPIRTILPDSRPEIINGLLEKADKLNLIKNKSLSAHEKSVIKLLKENKEKLIELQEDNNKLLDKNNRLLEMLISHQAANTVAQQPKVVKHTVGEILTSMVKTANNEKAESDRKYPAIKKLIQDVGLGLDSDYMDFYKPEIMHKIGDSVRNMPNVKSGTQRKYIQYVIQLIKHAHILEPDTYKENLIQILPKFEKTPKSQQKPHMPYTDDQLSEMFDPKHDFFKKNPDQFWTAMIALFTGSRQNAAMTLQYGDVLKKDGLDCIHFTENHSIKHLKTEASERIVPIAQQFLNLGFVEYVRNRQAKLKAADTDFIFPKCQTSGGQENNKFATRGILKFLSDIDIKDKNGDKQDFHSFRKNASLRLQKVGVLPTFINDIIGWEGKSTMEQSYSNHRLPEIKEQVDKLNYDFLQPHFDKWKEIMKGV